MNFRLAVLFAASLASLASCAWIRSVFAPDNGLVHKNLEMALRPDQNPSAPQPDISTFVTWDATDKFDVRVEGADLAGTEVRAQVLDAEFRPIQGVICHEVAKFPVPPAGATLEPDIVKLRLDGSVSDFAEIETPYLRLLVRPDSVRSAAADREVLFHLRKRWKLNALSAQLVPLGDAATIRRTAAIPPSQPPSRPQRTSRTGSPPRAHPVPPPRTRPVPPPRLGRVNGASPTVRRSEATVRTRRGDPAKFDPRAIRNAIRFPTKPKIVDLSKFRFGLSTMAKSNQAKGPSTSTVDLLEGLEFDPRTKLELNAVIKFRVYRDLNPASGVFYFLPNQYSLRWEQEKGYAMNVVYGSERPDGSGGDVRVTVTLDSGVTRSDFQLAAELLEAYRTRHSGPEHTSLPHTALQPMPIDAEPLVSLSVQSLYEIPVDRIKIQKMSDILSQIDITWVVDSTTTDEIVAALTENVGLRGSVTFQPTGEGLPAQRIDAVIRLGDEHTFGQIDWNAGKEWTNTTPFPLRLKYLHALSITGGKPVVHSWEIDDLRAPSGASVKFHRANVPNWLDDPSVANAPRRMWIEVVAEESAVCAERAVHELTSGVATAATQSIEVGTLGPLATTGAHRISIELRSARFDPRRTGLQIRELSFDADDVTRELRIFDAAPGASEPVFEYRVVSVTMPDGTVHDGKPDWTASTRMSLLIGELQLREALGYDLGTAR